MAEPVPLVDMERVHVGAKRDRALSRLRTLERADDPRPGETAMHLDAEFGEALRHLLRCPMLLERGLGMGVDVAPPIREVAMEIGDAVDDGHGVLSFRRSRRRARVR